jgi:hypothetical protein
LNHTQQVLLPGGGIAMFLLRQQVAIAGMGADPDQDRLAALVDFIMGTDGHGGQRLGLVDRASRFYRGVDNVGDRAQGQGEIEDILEELDDAAERTVADEHQAEDDLAEQGFGDGDREQDLLVVGPGWGESLVESLLGLVGLLIDEFAADVVGVGKG